VSALVRYESRDPGRRFSLRDTSFVLEVIERTSLEVDDRIELAGLYDFSPLEKGRSLDVIELALPRDTALMGLVWLYRIVLTYDVVESLSSASKSRQRPMG
jgi:hypothetical protein